MSDPTTNYSATRAGEQHNENTLRLEEQRLHETVTRNYVRLIARTQKFEHLASAAEAHRHAAINQFEEKNATTFVVLPRGTRQNGPHWLIELLFLTMQTPAYGIEAAGDVALGVMRYGSKRPDLDLGLYGVGDKGVSRRHALLRPTFEALTLIDLDSVNGTWINQDRLRPNTAMTLRSGDIISLAALTFAIRIISTPDDLGNSDGHGELH